MKNEPVAWMSQGGDVTRSRDYFVEMGFTDLIPLYTHPVQKPMMVLDGNRVYPVVKELTDEEIKAVYGEYFNVENCDWLHLQCIQAILRKAQEK